LRGHDSERARAVFLDRLLDGARLNRGVISDADELCRRAAVIADETKEWSKVVKFAGFKPE